MLQRNDMIGPWAGLPVAWTPADTFDEDAYRTDVAKTCAAGAPGIYTAGTTGEFYATEIDEWTAITKATIDECRKQDTPVMIGITATSTRGAQRRAEVAAEAGADAVQIALPYWMALEDEEVVPFFEEVAGACPGLSFNIYETLRSKKALTLDQHRAIHEQVEGYSSVKANAETLGFSPEGCRQLSEFLNVWVGELAWCEFGPHGAIGAASSLIYMHPQYLLDMFALLQAQDWDELQGRTDYIKKLKSTGMDPFRKKGYKDTAIDRLTGKASGFLSMRVQSRGPYVSATDDDVAALRSWMEANTPKLIHS